MKAQGRRPRGLAPIALLALALHAAGARADALGATVFSLNGFGTLGLTHSSEKQADFTSGFFKPSGAGHTRNWSADVDSRAGLQLTASVTPRLSAILQVIAEQNYDNRYRPHVEWANIRYQITPDFSIRAGRIVLPTFLVSDYRKVGYANPWVRPPIEYYGLMPVTSSDGVDATYRTHVGELTGTAQGVYGRSESRLPIGGTIKGTNLWNLSFTAEYRAVTARITYLRANLTVQAFKPLFDGFRRFGPQGVGLAQKYEVDDTPFDLVGFGAIYDPGSWFLTGEWGSANSRSELRKRTAWYASGGYRLGKATPYLTYARTTARSDSSNPGLTLSTLPPPLVRPATELNAALAAILASAPTQKALSVGVRWDFARSAALKVQLDHIRLGTGSPGTLINIQPGFQPGSRFTVVSATLDFVF